MADATLRLRCVVDEFERPMMDDIEGYESMLRDSCRLLAGDGRHLGAAKMEQIRTALQTAFKIGYMRGMKS